MLEEFKNNLIEIGLADLIQKSSEKNIVLLAVSGGIDSVVMTDLFSRAGILCAIAHCNFSLRGFDSDDDESFVRSLSSEYNFRIHVNKYDTLNYAADNNISVQMAARDLRYKYFYELIDKYNYRFVATAHHKDDVAETMLLNLVRGTGLAGMHGIVNNNRVIRPLLFADKDEIISYAKTHNLKWREDKSNESDYYNRNKIRNNVFPVLKEINPSVTDAFVNYASRVSKYEHLIEDYIDLIKPSVMKVDADNGTAQISLSQLSKHKEPELILFHLVRMYGFNISDCVDMIQSNTEGAVFYANNNKIVLSRGHLYLSPENTGSEDIVVDWPFNLQALKLDRGSLKIEEFIADGIIKSGEFRKEFTPSTVLVDAGKITFPMKVRRWKKSDYFYPFGMKGRKLISDYFTDNKFSPPEKDNTILLLSGDDIVWIVGYRADDRFKVTENTKKMYKLTWLESNKHE